VTALRCFTSEGLNTLRTYLQDSREGHSPDYGGLSQAPGLSVEWTPKVDIRDLPAAWSKRDIGEYLYKTLIPSTGTPEDTLRNQALWAWLAVNWIDVLAPADSHGRRPVKGTYRWIPEPGFQTYYRHLLALPFRVVWQSPKNPNVGAVLLTGHPTKPGELTEQLASQQTIFSSPSLLGAASKLYVKPGTLDAKVGAAGKNTPGSARRFAAVINQLSRTFDLNEMSPDTIIAKLPAEFDGFR
jgi:hypothetical protein